MLEIVLPKWVPGQVTAANAGIAFLACWAVSPHLESKKLVGRSLGNPGFRRNWYAVTLRNHRKTKYMIEFLNLLTVDGPKYMEWTKTSS